MLIKKVMRLKPLHLLSGVVSGDLVPMNLATWTLQYLGVPYIPRVILGIDGLTLPIVGLLLSKAQRCKEF